MYDKKKVQTLVNYLENTPIINLVDEFDIEVDLKGRCSCLLHEETKPSMFIDFQKNKWHCFSCQQGGGVANLIDHYYRQNCGSKHYFDSLSKYLSKHKEIRSETGLVDLNETEYHLSEFNAQSIIDRCNQLMTKTEFTQFKIKEKPALDAPLSEIMEYLKFIQTGG